MKKIYYTWSDVEKQTGELLRQIALSNWRPDYIVGITRGGLVPANLLSQYLDVPMETLKVSLRDSSVTESKSWMAEDACGYIPVDMQQGIEKRTDATYRRNILIVDDINDSGATLNWIKQDWQANCLPFDETWEHVWGSNVRVATLVDNEASGCEIPISYSAVDLNKNQENCWIVFPWEKWWGFM